MMDLGAAVRMHEHIICDVYRCKKQNIYLRTRTATLMKRAYNGQVRRIAIDRVAVYRRTLFQDP
jgi:hypothetical protein